VYGALVRFSARFALFLGTFRRQADALPVEAARQTAMHWKVVRVSRRGSWQKRLQLFCFKLMRRCAAEDFNKASTGSKDFECGINRTCLFALACW